MHHHLNLLSSRAASPTPAQGRPAGRPVAPASPSDLTSAIYRRAAAAVLAGAMIVTATAHAAGSGSVPGAAVRQAPGTPREWVRTDVREPSYDAGGMLEPRGVAPAPGELFYVADKGHDRIVVVNALGAIVRSIGSSGDGDGELTAPSDVAVDAARDRIYVAYREHWRFTDHDVTRRRFTLLGMREWTEPLTAYRGVLRTESFDSASRRELLYSVGLIHRSRRDRNVKLYESKEAPCPSRYLSYNYL